MRNAPSVIYPVGRCRLQVVLLGLLGLSALGLLVGWQFLLNVPSGARLWVVWLAPVCWASWLVWVAWDWCRSPVGRLQWDALAPAASWMPADGQGAWRWLDTDAREATPLDGVVLAIDMQHLVLLRLMGAGQPARWAWVERRRDPSRWNDLRRALRSTVA